MKSAIPRPQFGVFGGIPRCRSKEWDHPPLQPLPIKPMEKRVLLVHGMTWYAPGFIGRQWVFGPTCVGLGHFGSRVFRIQSLSFSFSSVDRSVDKRCADYDSPFVLDSISNRWNVAEFLRPIRPIPKGGRQPWPAAHAGPQLLIGYRRPDRSGQARNSVGTVPAHQHPILAVIVIETGLMQ